MHIEFVIDALEQALYDGQPSDDVSLTHHSNRGRAQYLSILYSALLAEAGIESSVGSKGDSFDDALAEPMNGLHRVEVIHRCGPWKTRQAVELATLEWVAWFNHHR
jgi:putative transposase